MKSALVSALAATGAHALSAKRATCPSVYVFGARETTAAAGYGSTAQLVDEIVAAYPGAGSAAISYPACGGQSTCGGDSYSQSVAAGTTAVCSAVSSYAAQCPDTKIVLVGYSQGAEIFDNALCGNGDPNQGLSSTCSISSYNIAAAIFMGDPKFKAGATFNVGTCSVGGFDSITTTCGSYNSKIKSYCDSSDPYCCNGDDAATHNGYEAEYGSQALAFVQSMLGSGTTTGTSPTSTPTGTTGTGGTGSTGSGSVAEYGQCGGSGYTGATTCVSPYTCTVYNEYYSQCL
ncbi:cutinase-domain-containing protein [Xylariaceae sp. FL0804]|nr:cutinase-domain-containing protein [Xylariaceae sp. FL0804]